MRKLDLMTLYERLYHHFGPQHWWPVIGDRDRDSARFEICVGAILTQNTAWRNVELALHRLARAKLIHPRTLARASLMRLGRCLRPAGYFNQKARKLKLFAAHVEDRGGLGVLFSQPVGKLRSELLSLWGIGPETADSIILYAAKKPSFVIDAYTKRLLETVSVQCSNYDEYQKFFESQLPRSVKLWNEFHALMVAWGKLFAKDSHRAIRLLQKRTLLMSGVRRTGKGQHIRLQLQPLEVRPGRDRGSS